MQEVGKGGGEMQGVGGEEGIGEGGEGTSAGAEEKGRHCQSRWQQPPPGKVRWKRGSRQFITLMKGY